MEHVLAVEHVLARVLTVESSNCTVNNVHEMLTIHQFENIESGNLAAALIGLTDIAPKH